MSVDEISRAVEEERDGGADTAEILGNHTIAVEVVVKVETEALDEVFGISLVVLNVDAYELDFVSMLRSCGGQ